MDGWQANPRGPAAAILLGIRAAGYRHVEVTNPIDHLAGDGDRACAEVLANVRDRHTTAAVRSIKLGIAISITRFLNPGGDVNGTKSGGIGREDDNSER
jgi:hypothetical protein